MARGPFDPFFFTPLRVLGSPDYQWRFYQSDGRGHVERRELPDGAWVAQDQDVLRAEIEHGTEAGMWLARLKEAMLLL